MRHALAAAALAALLGTAAGFGYWAGSAASARRIGRLEQSNRDLRASLDTLGEGLRQARAPLERRIHALEGALAANLGGAAEPAAPVAVAADPGATPEPDEFAAVAADPGAAPAPAAPVAPAPEAAPAKAAPVAAAPEAAPAPAKAAARAGDAPAPRELARSDLPTAPEPASDAPPRAAARAAKPVEAPKSRPAQAAAASLPAVGAPPPPAPAPATPDPHCRELQDPQFVLDAGGAMLRRLGDRLALRALEEPAGLELELGGPRGERYLLDSLPKHVAFDCDDTPYIVSVCSIDGAPAQVHGVIWHPETWRNPCED